MTVAVVTSPVARPFSLAMRVIGVNFRPSGNVLIAPLQTLDPEPHELEAAESVTAELRELRSRKPRTASLLFSSDAQCVPRPRTWRLNLSASGMTPALSHPRREKEPTGAASELRPIAAWKRRPKARGGWDQALPAYNSRVAFPASGPRNKRTTC